jgi:hypothetical protein
LSVSRRPEEEGIRSHGRSSVVGSGWRPIGLIMAFGVVLASGAIVFLVGDRLVAILGGKDRKNPEGASGEMGESSGLGIVLGTMLDGIPESELLGMSLVGGVTLSLFAWSGYRFPRVPRRTRQHVELRMEQGEDQAPLTRHPGHLGSRLSDRFRVARGQFEMWVGVHSPRESGVGDRTLRRLRRRSGSRGSRLTPFLASCRSTMQHDLHAESHCGKDPLLDCGMCAQSGAGLASLSDRPTSGIACWGQLPDAQIVLGPTHMGGSENVPVEFVGPTAFPAVPSRLGRGRRPGSRSDGGDRAPPAATPDGGRRQPP